MFRGLTDKYLWQDEAATAVPGHSVWQPATWKGKIDQDSGLQVARSWVRDVKVMRIRLLGGADPLVRGRPPGRPLLFW
jgi:hypothetical protein